MCSMSGSQTLLLNRHDVNNKIGRRSETAPAGLEWLSNSPTQSVDSFTDTLEHHEPCKARVNNKGSSGGRFNGQKFLHLREFQPLRRTLWTACHRRSTASSARSRLSWEPSALRVCKWNGLGWLVFYRCMSLTVTVVESARELPLIARLVRLRLQYHRLDDFEVIRLDFVFLNDHVLDWLQCLPALVFGFRFEGIWKTEINCSLEFRISEGFSTTKASAWVSWRDAGGPWVVWQQRIVSCDLFPIFSEVLADFSLQKLYYQAD